MSEPSPSIDPQPTERSWQESATAHSAHLPDWLKREFQRKEQRAAAERAQSERIAAVEEREP